jgi:hypothetical protein
MNRHLFEQKQYHPLHTLVQGSYMNQKPTCDCLYRKIRDKTFMFGPAK